MAGGGSGEDNPVGINVTALVDIIFCLCLFFMCSLKFKELDGKMDSWLPKNKGNATNAPPQTTVDEIRILVSYDVATGRLDRLFGRRPVPYTEEGNTQLQQLIRQEYDNQRQLGKVDVPVIIDAGSGVPWQELVRIMNMCRAESIEKIEFGMGSVAKLDTGAAAPAAAPK
jgi:biopolymer transport protein ExbD